jgi:primosomal protein N' (replication factor Y)
MQPSLLLGFPLGESANSGPRLAAENPVASVLVDSPLPHLDRPFDYSVPAELADAALTGTRVKVRFGGQDLGGFVLERLSRSTSGHALSPLAKVVSPVQVLTPEVLELARRVAARYAGTLSDVLRAAVPPRVARLEKELQAREAEAAAQLPASATPPSPAELPAAAKPGPPATPEADESQAWGSYTNGRSFLKHLKAGDSPRAAVSVLRGYGRGGWPSLIAAAVAAVRASGRGAVVVVPDYRDLDRMEKALTAVLPESDIARLSSDDGATPRYRNFLRLLDGSAKVAVGTRSAAFAPVANLGLVVCWDDGDDLHIDQRAPYVHSRDVLLLRAEQLGAACLLAAHSRSTEVQRLVESGWAAAVAAERTTVRSEVPRVVNTADSFEQERDPLARMARLPGAAWRAAREGLERGPVLVQVARAGYAPSLVCETCREPARCARCQGPLAVPPPTAPGASSLPQCRWCSTPEPDWHCRHCGGSRLRRGAAGVLRTSEELGKAFPGVSVVTSSGDQVKAGVGDAKALVVATVGAEPLADGGYAAALLLDGNSLLRRENLRAGEDTVRRWFNAAALVRPAREGGLVVVTADDPVASGALVRWDAPGFAARELSLRQELQLPPAVRIASVTGARADVEHFTAALAELGLRSAGPAPVAQYSRPRPGGAADPETASEVRTLFFIPYARAAEATRVMRAVKAVAAARRTSGPVQLRLDGVDVL